MKPVYFKDPPLGMMRFETRAQAKHYASKNAFRGFTICQIEYKTLTGSRVRQYAILTDIASWAWVPEHPEFGVPFFREPDPK